MAAMLPIFSAIAPLLGSMFTSSSESKAQKSDQKFQAEQAALNRQQSPVAEKAKAPERVAEQAIVGETIAEKQKKAVRAERAAAPKTPTKVTRSGVSIVGGR